MANVTLAKESETPGETGSDEEGDRVREAELARGRQVRKLESVIQVFTVVETEMEMRTWI